MVGEPGDGGEERDAGAGEDVGEVPGGDPAAGDLAAAVMVSPVSPEPAAGVAPCQHGDVSDAGSHSMRGAATGGEDRVGFGEGDIGRLHIEHAGEVGGFKRQLLLPPTENSLPDRYLPLGFGWWAKEDGGRVR